MSPRGYWPKLALGEITAVDDSGVQQTVSHYGLQGEQHSEVYRPQPHGFTSNPQSGATGLILSLGGERSRSVLLGAEGKNRPANLQPGAAKLYDDKGNIVFADMGNGVTARAAAGDVTVESAAGKVHILANGHMYVAPTDDSSHCYLGSKDGSSTAAVMTVSGPSKNVFAKV